MTVTRYLIVNADDFGLSPGVNRGVVEAHERGIVTSATLMVRWPAAVEAAVYARANPRLGVGLHLDLGEWAYRGGEWVRLYEVVPLDDPSMVAAEVERQIDSFFRLLGRAPTHIDSHQHVHCEEPVRTAVLAAAATLGVPVRHLSPGVQYCGDFYGQTGKGEPYPTAVTAEALVRVLSGLSEGVTELACHPGYGDDLDSMYRSERVTEVNALCHPAVRAVVESSAIVLTTFSILRAGVG
jgi:predicted glycoside hydrolase/deacetylase ChbG (UPF0249 family)